MLHRLFAAHRPTRRPAVRTFRSRVEALEDRAVPAFLAPVISAGGFNAVGDFNGDGRADLVVADDVADGVSIRLGRGDGTFQPAGPAQAVPGLLPAKEAVADFDGDGKLDVLAGRTGAMLVLRGNGDGTLRPPVATSLGSGAWTLTESRLADMNHDGRADVVAWLVERAPGSASRFAPSRFVVKFHLQVRLGQADGSFLTAYRAQLSQALSGIHTGDFDGDGRQDVMTVANSANRILRGKGDGTLDSTNSLAHEFVAADLTVADLNGDGKADVIRQDAGGTTSTVFLGQGNGKFTKTETVAVVGTPVVADVNRDGRPDLVSINSAAGTVRVLLGNGDGKFKPAQDFAAGPSPTDLALADFDGDGWLDALIGTSSGLSVLRNNRAW